ncbi:MAG: ribose 5-phosphate isomerase B [Myxococcales bacterium]|nr:ribose 5-phosphate isomerase B [Myxococcales bacterium]
MRILIGSDHGGLTLKNTVCERVRGAGHVVVDVGTDSGATCDYPDYAVLVARGVAAGEADVGILVCGTGQGMAMCANRVSGVRAAVVADVFSAKATRQHNDANVLCLGERVIGAGLAGEIVDAFLAAHFEGGRHAGRVAKMVALEAR